MTDHGDERFRKTPVWDWVIDKLERLVEVCSGRTVGAVNAGAMTLNWFCLLLIGAFLGDLITRLEDKGWWSGQVWRGHWPLAPLILGYVLTLLWNRLYVAPQVIQVANLRNHLEWLYTDLEFKKHTKRNIRCTLWVPHWRTAAGVPIRLRQIVDYIPRRSKIQDQRRARYHRNPRAGRSFKLMVRKGAEDCPVGLLGMCVFGCLNEDVWTIYRAEIPDGVDLVDHYVSAWNFKPRHARRMTNNKRSMICIPIVGGSKNILGVVYCDSTQPAAFAGVTWEKVARQLERLADTLVS